MLKETPVEGGGWGICQGAAEERGGEEEKEEDDEQVALDDDGHDDDDDGEEEKGGGLQKLAKEEGNTHNDMKHDKVDLW